MKPSYKAKNKKYCKHIETKNIDKNKKGDKYREQFAREHLKYCDTEKYDEQKRKDRVRNRLTKKRGKMRQL